MDTTLAVTIGLVALAVLIGWRLDWRRSISSRRLSVGCAVVAALVAAAISIPLPAFSGMGLADQAIFNPSLAARTPNWWPFYLALLPLLIGVAVVALVSARRNRLLVAAVGLATFVLGYAAVLGAFSFVDALAMVKPTYVNQTSQPISISHQKTQDPSVLLDYSNFDPGESYYNPVGYRVEGDWIRIVAHWPDGTVVFDRTYTWDELRHDSVIKVAQPEAKP